MVTAVGDIPAAKDFIVMCMIMILTVTAAKAMVVVIKIAVFKNIAATLAGLPEILSNMHPSTQDMKMSILATRRFMVLRYPLPYEHFHHIRLQQVQHERGAPSCEHCNKRSINDQYQNLS